MDRKEDMEKLEAKLNMSIVYPINVMLVVLAVAISAWGAYVLAAVLLLSDVVLFFVFRKIHAHRIALVVTDKEIIVTKSTFKKYNNEKVFRIADYADFRIVNRGKINALCGYRRNEAGIKEEVILWDAYDVALDRILGFITDRMRKEADVFDTPPVPGEKALDVTNYLLKKAKRELIAIAAFLSIFYSAVITGAYFQGSFTMPQLIIIYGFSLVYFVGTTLIVKSHAFYDKVQKVLPMAVPLLYLGFVFVMLFMQRF